MKASQDELKSIFKQAFEACGYDFGRCELAAESIVWAEMLGLNVFALATECLQPFPQGCSTSEVLIDEPQRLILDNQGKSILASAIEIVNLGIANTLSGNGDYEIEIRNAAHPMLIAKILCDCRHHGLAASAYWRDARNEQTLELRTNMNHDYPEIFHYSEMLDIKAGELNITFTQEQAAYHSRVTSSKNFLLAEDCVEQHLTVDYFAQQYQHSLNHGVSIDAELWRDLLILGAEVLVESSELSRQGAGS